MNNVTSFEQYIPLALRTLKELPPYDQHVHAIAGLVGEWGEVIDALKKHVIYGKPLDKVNLAEELGDIAYFMAVHFYLTGTAPDMLDSLIIKNSSFIPRRDTVNYDTIKMAILGSMLASSLLDLSECMDFNFRRANFSEMFDMYLYILAVTGVSFTEVLNMNINKLVKRYGDKYSDFKAVNRDTEAERQVLEGKPSV